MNGATKWIVGLAIVALVWGGLRLMREMAPEPEVTSSEFGERAGEWLGKQISEQFPDGGPIGVVQRGGDSEVHEALRAYEIRGLKRGLSGKGFTLVYPDSRDRSSSAGTLQEREGGGRTTPMSGRWEGADAPPVAVVSFVGVPPKTGKSAALEAPPLFAFVDAFEFGWVPKMRRGELRACVMMKYGGDWGAPPALNQFAPDRVLGARYACVTPDSMDALLDHYTVFVDENGARR